MHTLLAYILDSKVHGANMGPIWGQQDPDGHHVGPVNFAIWDASCNDLGKCILLKCPTHTHVCMAAMYVLNTWPTKVCGKCLFFTSPSLAEAYHNDSKPLFFCIIHFLYISNDMQANILMSHKRQGNFIIHTCLFGLITEKTSKLHNQSLLRDITGDWWITHTKA